jgi:adenylate kinase family enzyme
MPFQRIHITGASGAGVTSLGRALAARLETPHFDVDDYYWVPTVPPFRLKRAIPERIALLSNDMRQRPNWVVSGSLGTWGDSLIADAHIILYLETPTDVRLQRLRQREAERFGDWILPGGPMHEQFQAFLEWAAGYDTGLLGGRSRPRHAEWLAHVPTRVMRLSGLLSLKDLVEAVLAAE